jgi:predicted RND superfamily exporter protein
MFQLLSRFIRSLHQSYRTLAILTTLISLIALFALTQLEFRFSLLEIFPKDLPARQKAEELQENFGGFGKLTVIIKHQDSLQNFYTLENVHRELQNNSLIHFIEYQKETVFFEKNKLLYISLEDLESIRERISQSILREKLEHNPLLVFLDEEGHRQKSALSLSTTIDSLQNMEKKYLHNLQQHIGSPDGHIMMLNIFPAYDITLSDKNQLLFKQVQEILNRYRSTEQEVLYAGDVYDNLHVKNSLLDEIWKSSLISAFIFLIALAIFFRRQPQLPLLLFLPLSNSLLWTAGLAWFLFGYLNIFTFALGIILIGLGMDSGIHLLARYGEERRKKVKGRLAMEHALLETGPAITISSWTTAITFFALAFIPLEGIAQFGIIAGSGILFSWFNIIVIFPPLFLRLQKKRLWKVYGDSYQHFHEFSPKPFRYYKHIFAGIIVLLIVSTLKGLYPHFEYNFRAIDFAPHNEYADKLLYRYDNSLKGLTIYDIAEKDAPQMSELLQKIRKQHPESGIRRVYHLSALLPEDQSEKLEILEEIDDMLTPQLVKSLPPAAQEITQKLLPALQVSEITLKDLPSSLKRKFLIYPQHDSLAHKELLYLLPSFDVFDAQSCRTFSKYASQVEVNDSTTYYGTGQALLIASMLNLTLPYLPQAFLYALLVILFLILSYQARWKRLFLYLLPTLIAAIWFFGTLNWLGWKGNVYNSLLFPVLVGLSMDGSFHLWQRYFEEGRGSLFFVLKRTGLSVLLASITSVIGFSGLLFSGHYGLRSIALMAALGLFYILLANVLVFAAFSGIMDKRLKSDTSHHS